MSEFDRPTHDNIGVVILGGGASYIEARHISSNNGASSLILDCKIKFSLFSQSLTILLNSSVSLVLLKNALWSV
jgi:hypothetical protein